MDLKKFEFDLQLFADETGAEGEAPPADNSAEAESPQGENPQTPAPTGTILGGALAGEEKNDAQEQSAVPEAYDFKDAVPEGMEYSEEQAAAFSALAKECSLTQEQASKLAAYGMKYAQDGIQAAAETHAATVAQWAQTAKTELGGDYDNTVAMAARGIRVVESKVPGIREMLDETGAGNRVEMIRLLAELGDLVGEDPGLMGGGAAGAAPIYGNTNFDNYK